MIITKMTMRHRKRPKQISKSFKREATYLRQKQLSADILRNRCSYISQYAQENRSETRNARHLPNLKPINQKFFRAGEVSWNKDTSMNILPKTHEKKAQREKLWSFFSQILSKLRFEQKRLKMDTIRTIFSKIRETLPPPPPRFPCSCASEYPHTSLSIHQYF